MLSLSPLTPKTISYSREVLLQISSFKMWFLDPPLIKDSANNPKIWRKMGFSTYVFVRFSKSRKKPLRHIKCIMCLVKLNTLACKPANKQTYLEVLVGESMS